MELLAALRVLKYTYDEQGVLVDSCPDQVEIVQVFKPKGLKQP